MVSIFRVSTQSARTGSRAIALSYIDRGRKAILAKLPEEDLNLKRDSCLPKPRGSHRGMATAQLSIQGLDSELARARKSPRDHVSGARQPHIRYQSPQALQVFQLRPQKLPSKVIGGGEELSAEATSWLGSKAME